MLGEGTDVAQADRRLLASGCERVETSDQVSADALGAQSVASVLEVWLQEGRVAVLRLSVLPDRVEVPGDVPRTWLGPTLRSPMATALEVPGDELVVDDPRGPGGAGVRNVVVPLEDGGEVVYSDPPVRGVASLGSVTSITLRTEAGRACRVVPGEDLARPGQLAPPQAAAVPMGPDGTTDVRLGDPVTGLVSAGTVTPAAELGFDPFGGGRCDVHATPDGLQVFAGEDRVVGIGSYGYGTAVDLGTTPGIRSGQPLADLADLTDRRGVVEAPVPSGMNGTALDVQVAPGVRARVHGAPDLVVTETAGLLVDGELLVEGVLLYEGDEPADRLCR